MLHEAGELEEAEACFRKVLAAQAGDVDALFHLGALLQARKRDSDAADVFRTALRHAPDNAHLWMRLGDLGAALRTEESLKEASRCFTRAAELEPGLFEAHFNLGYVCALLGRHDEAVRSYRGALLLRPDHPACQANLLDQQQRICDWTGFDALCEQRRASARARRLEEPLPVPFGLLSIPSTPAEQLAGAAIYSRAIAARAASQAYGAQQPPARMRSGPGSRRPRVGYLSADFHEHVTAHVMAEVFELHDRSRFETIAYSYGADDRSAVRARLERAFERFVDLRQHSNVSAAALIREHEVDILVDMKGYTLDARTEIVALRPAPIQVSYLGYPATMGADFIDYIVTDRCVLPPEDLACYAEKPVYLPHSYYPSDRRRPIGEPPARASLGLPDAGFVFCCFNQAYKIAPHVFAAWMRLLRALPGAVLWLLENNRWANNNLRAEARRQDVDPGRLIFATKTGPEMYLRRLRAADLFLDTEPYNAHTTANDALWVGLPVVTCAGKTLPSRVAASQLHAIGLPELVADSLEGYEATTLRLARAPGELSAIREKLMRARASAPLFDTPRYVRHLESAFEIMWETHCAGSAPRMIEV